MLPQNKFLCLFSKSKCVDFKSLSETTLINYNLSIIAKRLFSEYRYLRMA